MKTQNKTMVESGSQQQLVPNFIATPTSVPLDLKRVLENALEQAHTALKAEAGIVYLQDPASHTFHPVIHHGISQDVLMEVIGFKMGQGLSGAVAASNQTLLVADLATDRRNISPAASRQGWHGYAGVPIKSKNTVMGVMVLLTHREGHFKSDHLSLLNHVASDIEVAMENVRLGQEARFAQAALHDSEERYRILFEDSRDAVYITTRDGMLVDANQSFLNLFGHTKQDTMNLDIRELYVNHDDRSKFQREIEQNGSVRDYEVKLRKKDGTEMDCLITATLRKDAGGSILGYQGMIQDINEQKRGHEALHGKKEKFRIMVEESPLGVSIIDKNGHYKYINPTFTGIFGYTLEDIPTGREWFKKAYSDQEYRKQVIATWIGDLETSKRGECRPRMFAVKCKDGAEKVICFRAVTMDTGDQSVIYEDITERTRSEEALRENEELYRMLFNSGNDAIFVHQPTAEGRPGKFLEVNDIACHRYGFTREEFLKLSPSDISAPENVNHVWMRLKKLFMDKHFVFETLQVAKDGRRIPVEISSHLFNLKGQPTVISIARDLTERKQAEKKLLESETRYRLLADNVADTICTVDLNMRLTYASPPITRLLGYSVDEAKAKKMGELFTPASYDLAMKVLAEELTIEEMEEKDLPRSWILELGLIRKDGSVVPVEAHYTFLRDPEGRPLGILTVMRDMTERKQAQQVLRESEEKFKTLAEESPNMIFINSKGKVLYVNEKCEEILGYKRDEFYGRDFDFLTLIAPESKGLVESSFQKYLKGEEVEPYEHTIITRDGKTVEAIINVRLINYKGEMALLGVVTDITERKRAEEELRARQEELELKTIEIENTNTALKVLLKQREQDRAELEERIMTNVKDLVLPGIERIKASRLDARQMAYVGILELHINDIVSPFAQKLLPPHSSLTFKELQVASLIKQGKVSKEIADLLNISPSTVKFHRENLRRKLGLRKTKINLTAHLLSLE